MYKLYLLVKIKIKVHWYILCFLSFCYNRQKASFSTTKMKIKISTYMLLVFGKPKAKEVTYSILCVILSVTNHTNLNLMWKQLRENTTASFTNRSGSPTLVSKCKPQWRLSSYKLTLKSLPLMDEWPDRWRKKVSQHTDRWIFKVVKNTWTNPHESKREGGGGDKENKPIHYCLALGNTFVEQAVTLLSKATTLNLEASNVKPTSYKNQQKIRIQVHQK